MSDMRLPPLPHGAHADHNTSTLSIRVAHLSPPPVARELSNPSWKVIVSASRGQYLKPGSPGPGFFSFQRRAEMAVVDSCIHSPHHSPMLTVSCTDMQSKKAPRSGSSDRRTR